MEYTIRDVLSKDPVLERLIQEHGVPVLEKRNGSPFEALVRSIIGQQLSGAAATTIRNRLFELYGDAAVCPSAQQIRDTAPEELQKIGVSRQKATYLYALADAYCRDESRFERFHALSDNDITQYLVSIKGIGEWTVHMFLLFYLGREDILPTGDLGVRKGMMKVYDLPELPQSSTMTRIAAPWQPYRSFGTLLMWRALDSINPIAK